MAIFVPAPSPKQSGGQRFSLAEEQGVNVYRAITGKRSRFMVFLQTFAAPGLRQAWQEVLEREKPDLVHVEHMMGIPLDFVNDLRQRMIPFVVTLHDYWYVCANAQLLRNTDNTICAGPQKQAINCAECALARSGMGLMPAVAPLAAPMLRQRNKQAGGILQTAERLIAPTRFVRDIYLDLAPDSTTISVLPHGIDLPKSIDRQARLHERRDTRLHIGYIGSIAPQKGVHVLIEAANALSDQETTLTIYGDLTTFPDYAAGIEKMITRPGIHLAGLLDRQALWTAAANLDVVVLPTLWYETSVLVIDEVNAMGVPVVASDIGVMRERIDDGQNGRLFRPGDARALRTILEELTANREVLSLWRNKIKAVTPVAEHIRGLEEIYAKVISAV